MFTLQDGREHLYQWDLDRYIVVNDDTICEVHFCNRTSDCSLVVEVKDGLAAIPNILLQDARPIRAYAYCDDKFTKTEKQFSVKARTQPADYVYTETETLQYSTIDTRMTELENSIESIVKTEVSAYIEENPLKVDLDNYYTKEETDTAIYNSKDAYFLNFSNVSYDKKDADAEMIAFAERYRAGQSNDNFNICCYIWENADFGNAEGWQTALIRGSRNKIYLTGANLNPEKTLADQAVRYVKYCLSYENSKWVYYAEEIYEFTIATTEYVSQAIADSAQGEVDLSNYYTKEEVNSLIPNVSKYQTEEQVTALINEALSDIATAEGGSY